MYIDFILSSEYINVSIQDYGVIFLKHGELSFPWSMTKEQDGFWSQIYNRFYDYVKNIILWRYLKN